MANYDPRIAKPKDNDMVLWNAATLPSSTSLSSDVFDLGAEQWFTDRPLVIFFEMDGAISIISSAVFELDVQDCDTADGTFTARTRKTITATSLAHLDITVAQVRALCAGIVYSQRYVKVWASMPAILPNTTKITSWIHGGLSRD